MFWTALSRPLFLSTLSLRRATISEAPSSAPYAISIHALLAESDHAPNQHLCPSNNFYPRSPCGERQPAERHASSQQEFLSTLSLRRATYLGARQPCDVCDFYPRSPCGERPAKSTPEEAKRRFLSTLSLRRATARRALGFVDPDISIHALLAESDTWARGSRVTYVISIHALLAESDGKSNKLAGRKLVFLSTLSLRRAT